MAKHVDGFVIAIPKKKVKEYQKIARGAARVWKKYGALDYYETVAVDFEAYPGTKSFDKLAKTKKDETVVFAWIVYKSKAHRDQVNKKVGMDPWIQSFAGKEMPFKMNRMSVGLFKAIAES